MVERGSPRPPMVWRVTTKMVAITAVIKLATLPSPFYCLKLNLNTNLRNQLHLLVNILSLLAWLIQTFFKGQFLWWGNPVLLTCLWISCTVACPTFQKMLSKTPALCDVKNATNKQIFILTLFVIIPFQKCGRSNIGLPLAGSESILQI